MIINLKGFVVLVILYLIILEEVNVFLLKGVHGILLIGGISFVLTILTFLSIDHLNNNY